MDNLLKHTEDAAANIKYKLDEYNELDGKNQQDLLDRGSAYKRDRLCEMVLALHKIAKESLELAEETKRSANDLREHASSESQLKNYLSEVVPQIVKETVAVINKEEINTLRFEKIESTLKKFNLDGTSEINSQIVTGINELSSKIDNFKPMQPIDYSKLDFSEPLKRAVSTVPQLKKSPVAIQKHARQANDELVRSNNLIIYGAPYSESNSQLAVDAAKFYFEACGVDSYCFQMDKIVDAQFMKISEDKTTCNIRVIMSNPWVVRTLLRDAPLLKTEGANLSNCFDRNDNFSFAKTYISKDRTLAEQEKHRKLVLELKEKIKDDNSIRWIIKFGKVQAGGAYKAE